MERTAVAFAPGHISGYFRRIDGATPAETGSCGAGLVIDRGVTAAVRPADRTTVVITDDWCRLRNECSRHPCHADRRKRCL